MAILCNVSATSDRIALPPVSASFSDSHRLNEPYSLSSEEIIKWILINPFCSLASAKTPSANASTSERLFGSVLNLSFFDVVVIRFCLLAIHHTSEQIVKLAKIKLVWRDLDNVSSVP